jgi:alanyl-tRNA synthetase
MRKYWDDPYTFSFESRIIDVTREGDRLGVVLEETYFYPEGGGQPSDRGQIASCRVLDVQEVRETIVHFLACDDQAKEVLTEGMMVHGEIDRDYRLHNMRTHSACHLLFGAARKLFRNVSYAGFHIGDVGSLYLETGQQIRNSEARRIERLANEYVVEDRRVLTSFVEADRAVDIDDLAYNIDLSQGEVRIVQIEGWDVAACSGTHVRHTIEVGPIKILGRESHSKNVTRLDYAVGEQAVAEIARDAEVLAEIAEFLNTSRDQLSRIVQKMASDLQDAEKDVRELQERLVGYRAQELLNGGEEVARVRLLVETIDYLDSDSIRKMVAKTISEQDSVVIALIGIDDRLTITAGRSDDVNIDLSDPVVSIARANQGGGGGRANFVSAGGIVASAVEVQDELKTKLREALQER